MADLAPYVDDGDFTLYVGDALTVLRELPAESVHMCVTSPPYWGLRDYGTGTWEGGDAECDHRQETRHQIQGATSARAGRTNIEEQRNEIFRDVCGKCGAHRVDNQLGLEPTPDEYVANMVAVFREVKRVLRSDGTCFINIGDSYASSPISVQRMRNDDGGAGSGEGDVRTVLSPDGSPAVDRSEQRARTSEGSRVSPEAQGTSEWSDHSSPAADARGDHGASREPVPVLRRDGTCVPDNRPHSERWGECPPSSPPPDPQNDSGRRVSDGPVPDSLLELQLREGDARFLPPFGRLKQKDLVGIPWMLAFALRADGWYLRSDIIWSKPNPMPESVTDRPTKSHEYLFLLTKGPRYYWDADAIREADGGAIATPYRKHAEETARVSAMRDDYQAGLRRGFQPGSGRNRRSVWEIATEPYPDAHFATFPQALVDPCVKAGSSEWGCCPECGAQWKREVARELEATRGKVGHHAGEGPRADVYDAGSSYQWNGGVYGRYRTETVGWKPSCDHGHNPVPATVLDCFAGSGTTALVARRLGRRSIGIELSAEYAQLAARRLSQLSLLSEAQGG